MLDWVKLILQEATVGQPSDFESITQSFEHLVIFLTYLGCYYSPSGFNPVAFLDVLEIIQLEESVELLVEVDFGID